jgi:hypothetical protein
MSQAKCAASGIVQQAASCPTITQQTNNYGLRLTSQIVPAPGSRAFANRQDSVNYLGVVVALFLHCFLLLLTVLGLLLHLIEQLIGVLC